MSKRRGRPPLTHCKYGHSMADAYQFASGVRRCRECTKRNSRNFYREKVAPNRISTPRPEPPTMPTDPAILAYAAGILDGEGSISIPYAINKEGRKYHKVVVRVTNTDPRLPELLKKHFGGSIGNVSKNNPKHSPAQTWSVMSRHAEVFLRAIRPYVLFKQKQVDLALKLRESIVSDRGAAPLEAGTFEWREAIRQEVMALNRHRSLMPETDTGEDHDV